MALWLVTYKRHRPFEIPQAFACGIFLFKDALKNSKYALLSKCVNYVTV